MALTLVCDGCPATLPIGAASIGHLEPVFYCADCRATWDVYSKAEDQERARLIAAFEAWQAEALTAMRGKLRKLPDE